ncbi:hypothetical protein XELAEV_18031172mg [Xenopus laevis]|uniref:Uncharacterized protein n=1 Tax=Xenopus laevis TaxID=8355 RepID=A0A974CM40_XENLA|nr:hypothetical protein XELAEV_18031172mg [Xenopus laevis]
MGPQPAGQSRQVFSAVLLLLPLGAHSRSSLCRVQLIPYYAHTLAPQPNAHAQIIVKVEGTNSRSQEGEHFQTYSRIQQTPEGVGGMRFFFFFFVMLYKSNCIELETEL